MLSLCKSLSEIPSQYLSPVYIGHTEAEVLGHDAEADCMRGQTHLLGRGSKYYFRARIPVDLRVEADGTQAASKEAVARGDTQSVAAALNIRRQLRSITAPRCLLVQEPVTHDNH